MHRQAIFESKGDTYSCSAECRIRSWEVWGTKPSADWVVTHRLTELSRINQKLEHNSPFDEWARTHIHKHIHIHMHIHIHIYTHRLRFSISTYYALSQSHFCLSFPMVLSGYRVSGAPPLLRPWCMPRTFPVLVSRMTSPSTFQRDTLLVNGFNTILFPPSVRGQIHGYTLCNNYQI